ncbi:MAG: molecular chaperone DnaJ [Azovibrio sp.]|uniref:J domain-containing protein n=1 Tax=Azovibrio sp. TaxID=1872673 RepID=UPI003C71440D
MPLFGHKPVSTSARIVPTDTAPLSKDQKAFNGLIKKIGARRARMGEWEDILPIFRQKYASDLLPLQEQCLDLQWQLARALDAAHGTKGITKGEKRKLAELIVELSEAVLAHKDHGELKELFNKHSPSDYDEDEAARLEGMKAMLELTLGMDLGDDVDMNSPEEVLKRVESQFRAQQEAHAEAESSRKRSRQEEARAARQEAEEKQQSQSIREVFRKLASALHPDREPDPAEQARKTVLMQRANEAYEKGNLLQLLELQLELEHIDQAHLAAIRPERLKHYIKILKGQLEDLDMEIQHVEEQLITDFGLPPFKALHPSDLISMLLQDISTCQRQIAELQQQIATAADPKQLKAWLKTVSPHHPPYPDLDLPF